MDQLSLFYNNENQREAVKTFMVDVLKEFTVERAFEGQDVKGIQEARKIIEKTFDKLAEKYGMIEKPIIANSR